MREQVAEAIGSQVKHTIPPIVVLGASIAGWGVQEWMYATTIVYVLAQLGYLLWKWAREYRQSKAFAAKLAEPLDPSK